MTALANGERPHIDLNAVLGDRAKVRDVTLGDRTYQFRPLNLVAAQMLDEGKFIEVFEYLIIGDEATAAFMEAAPAAALPEIVTTVYGESLVVKPEQPSPTSPPKKAASKPSKRTSPRGASR